jgi:hypothetical protein
MGAGDLALIEDDSLTMATFRKEGYTQGAGSLLIEGVAQIGEAVEIGERVWNGEEAHQEGKGAEEKDLFQGFLIAELLKCLPSLRNVCPGLPKRTPTALIAV